MTYFKKLRSSLYFLLLASVLPSSAFADIEKLSVEGNYRIDQGSILAVVKTKAGDPLDLEQLRRDLKSIYRLGFFDNVEIDRRNGIDGDVIVFKVHERPAIKRVSFEGNDAVSTSTLREKLNLDERKFLDRKKLSASIRELINYYQGEGYYGTEITYSADETSSGEVNLTFKVVEGTKKLIREVRFTGVSKLDESDLESLIKTSSYFWLTSWATGSGVVKKEYLENDARLIQHHYLTKGYAEVKVATPTVNTTDKGLEVVFAIEEGAQYKFGKIDVSGNLINDKKSDTLDKIKSEKGEIFNVDYLREDVFSITDKFTDIGYAFTNVDPATKINRDSKTVDLNFNVDKGDKIKINRVNIVGNDKTQDNVIRRTIKINEQETFSSSKIKRSQELLKRLGYFDEVTISPEKTEKSGEVDLSVAVKEASTGQFSAGAGVSSGDGFIITSKIVENNLMGTGNSLSLDINSGQLRQNYIASFVNPRVNDSYLSFGTDVSVTQRNFEDFLRKQNGVGFNFGYPLFFLGETIADDVRANLGYELTQNEITDIGDDVAPFVKDQEGKGVSSALIPTLTRSTIDNPLDPTRGSKQYLRFDYAAVGGSQKYWTGQYNNYWYYPMVETTFGSFIFAQRTKLGWGESISSDRYPLFQRFFPGGINSIRGYQARQVGPKDDLGNYYGGNKQLILNFETIFPLVPSVGLNGVAFYDAGNAYDDDVNPSLSNLRQAIGWGVRWRSPLAPIRVEIGYPLDKEPGDKPVVVNFSFGAPL